MNPSATEPQDWVVDAGVAIQLFIAGPLSDRAHDLFLGLSADPPIRLHVPDLFYIEITNVLCKYVRWQGLPVEQAQTYLSQLGQLSLRSTPTADLTVEALTLAAVYSITTYDAVYLALAGRLDLPLVTIDQKLAQVIADPGRVRLLSNLGSL